MLKGWKEELQTGYLCFGSLEGAWTVLLCCYAAWWRGEEFCKHRDVFRRNWCCAKYQRMDFPSNVPPHTDPLVFIHVFISVKISSATGEEFMGRFCSSLELMKRVACLLFDAESLTFARTVRLYPAGLSWNQYYEPSLGKTTAEVNSLFLVLLDKALSGTVPNRAVVAGEWLKPAHCPQA